jgi:hypothetical protein
MRCMQAACKRRANKSKRQNGFVARRRHLARQRGLREHRSTFKTPKRSSDAAHNLSHQGSLWSCGDFFFRRLCFSPPERQSRFSTDVFCGHRWKRSDGVDVHHLATAFSVESRGSGARPARRLRGVSPHRAAARAGVEFRSRYALNSAEGILPRLSRISPH